MIKKLQRKFAISSMLIILAIIACVFLIITTVGFINLNTRLDKTINIIKDNNGYLPEYEAIRDLISSDLTDDSSGFVRFFSVVINGNENVIDANIEYMPNVSINEIDDVIEEALNNKKDYGYIDDLRYGIFENGEIKTIIFLDCGEELDALRDTIIKSITIIIIGLIFMFLIVSELAKIILKPIIANIENQKLFITNAGHELKTPLAVIMADVDVLEMTIGNDNEWINSIKSQSNRLNVLIKSLLSLSNIEAGKQEFTTTQFSLTKTIKESVQDFKALLQNKNVIFDDSKDVLVNADLNMIKQLITIFLDNSIKYTPDNGTIEIKLEKLSKGKGTKMEFLNTCENPRSINTKKLFDRFYRGDKSRNKTKEGYGIGLSIAKSIVDIHKGKISAFITKDERICFRVII